MDWFLNLPEPFATSVLDQLCWKDLAKLDSALCVRSFRPTFLTRIASGLRANKRKDHHINDNEDLNLGDYLHWVAIRRVPSVLHLDLNDRWPTTLIRSPSDVPNWTTFDSVISIQGVSEDEAIFEFTNDVISHCPNLQIASMAVYCYMGGGAEDKDGTLLPLFRACRKLQDLNAEIMSFSAEEAAEVPRTLQKITLTGSRVPKKDVKNIIQMINNLDNVIELDLGLHCLDYPPELFIAVSKHSHSLKGFYNYKGTGVIGAEVMLKSCVNLTHITMRACYAMTQEAFTMFFELPNLERLYVSGNNTIPGLLPSRATASPLKVLNILEFSVLERHGQEVKRILEACPMLLPRRSLMMGSVSRSVKDLCPELCTALRDFDW